MGTRPTKAKNNIFCKARLEAARYNDKLKSRAGAAEVLGYASESTISDWELGISVPTPEAVLKMSDLYNAPELINTYCHNLCPLGWDIPEITAQDLDRISIKALSAFQKISKTKEALLDIVSDGIISEDEQPTLEKVLSSLDELNAVTQELKAWVTKNCRKDE